MSTDYAYICAGSCKAAVIRRRFCGDGRCDRVGQPLRKVPVVYACIGSCQQRDSSVPGLCCSPDGCTRLGKPLVAKALVPASMQLPILDPPEENRSYSSIWKNKTVGNGNLCSYSGSKQGWSAGQNDSEQWMIIDAGSVIDSIRGVLVGGRTDQCPEQIVTQIAVDAAVSAVENNGQWDAVDGGRVFDIDLSRGEFRSDVTIRFFQPIRARYVRVRPITWEKHISMRCCLLLSGPARTSFVEMEPVEYRTMFDVNQFPDRVPLTYIPGGAPSSPPKPYRPSDIAEIPTGECHWAGRRSRWRVLTFNGQDGSVDCIIDNNRAARNSNGSDNIGTSARAFVVRPGEECFIMVSYEAWWGYDPRDYCPGCVVQLYYGMESVFCTGVVRNGIRYHHGTSDSVFAAPRSPGLYYITQSISLQYDFVDNVGAHRNTPHNAIAVVRVLPTSFKEDTFVFLPKAWQKQIRALMCLRNRQGELSNVFTNLPRGPLYEIFSHLMSQDPLGI